jgi:hypothetical protein
MAFSSGHGPSPERQSRKEPFPIPLEALFAAICMMIY